MSEFYNKSTYLPTLPTFQLFSVRADKITYSKNLSFFLSLSNHEPFVLFHQMKTTHRFSFCAPAPLLLCFFTLNGINYCWRT